MGTGCTSFYGSTDGRSIEGGIRNQYKASERLRMFANLFGTYNESEKELRAIAGVSMEW